MKDLNDIDPVALLRETVSHPFEQARAMPPAIAAPESGHSIYLAAEL